MKNILFFALVVLLGCTDSKNEVALHHLVSSDEIVELVKDLRFEKTDINGRNTGEIQKKDVAAVLEVPDNLGKTAFYIINFKKGGFIILSADDRVNPVRAFSNEGSFEFEIPAGLGGWLIDEQQYVADIRNGKIKGKKHKWTIDEINALLNSDGVIDPNGPIEGGGGSGDDGLGCSNTYEEIVLNTGLRWGQSRPNNPGSPWYSANTPFMNCSNRENGRPLWVVWQ